MIFGINIFLMPCTSIFFPMYREGKLVGIYAADLKLDFLQSLIGEYSHEKDGRISFVIDGEGAVVGSASSPAERPVCIPSVPCIYICSKNAFRSTQLSKIGV